MGLGCLQPAFLSRCWSLGSQHCGFLRSSVLSALPSTPGATIGAVHLPMFWPELSSVLLLWLTPSQPSTNVHLTADFIFPGRFLEDSISYCHHLYGDLLALFASRRLTPYFPDSLFSIQVVHRPLLKVYEVPGQILESQGHCLQGAQKLEENVDREGNYNNTVQDMLKKARSIQQRPGRGPS